MKADKAGLARALTQPDPAIRFYLFHGPDEAGSRALAIKLLRGLGDAEKFVVLGQSVKTDPASLADEAGAMALFGGKRAIWIEPAGDEIVDGVQALLDLPSSESAVVALAGILRKTSALLKLAESHRGAWSHVSYVPEGREAAATVVELGRARPQDFVRRRRAGRDERDEQPGDRRVGDREVRTLSRCRARASGGTRPCRH